MILHNAAVTGSLTFNGTDVSSITGSSPTSASFASQITSLNAATASLNTYTSSNNTNISALNAQSASFLAYTASNDAKITSLNTFSSSILSYTSSNDAQITSIYSTTSSLNSYTSSANTKFAGLDAASGSAITRLNALEVASGSAITRLSLLETASGSAITRLGALETASGSAITRLNSIENKTGSYATTGSNIFIGTQTITGSIFGSGSLTINGCITSTGQIVAQTINVQQVTSSIVYSCGSNIFGTAISNSQQLTGSVLITGSLTITGPSSATSYNGATIFGSTIACSPIGCFATSCATVALFTGCVGIGGTLNPSNPLHIYTNSNTTSSAIKLQNASACCLASVGIEFQLLTDFCDYKKAEIRAVASEQYANSIDLAFWSGGSTAAKHTERLRITSDGIACFACQVCAPAFVGGTVSGTTGTFSGDVSADNYKLSANSGKYYYLDTKTGNNFLGLEATNTFGLYVGGAKRLGIASTGEACFACQVCVPNIISTGVSGGRYGTFNAPTNGGYITFEAGGTAFGDLGSYCAQYGTGDATTLSLQSRTGYALALGTNSTEKVRIDTTGNLMVGSLSAGNAGTINVSVGCAGTTAGGLQLWASSAQTHYVQFGDGTAGAGPYAGYVGYAHSTDALLLGTGAATRAIITSAGVACFSGNVCAPAFIGGTMNGTTIYGSTAVCSPVGKFTSCIDVGSGTFSSSVTAASGTINGPLTINRNTTGLVLNRDAVTNYNGIYYSTAASPKWFIGMRENLCSNNHIHYSEALGVDVLTLNQSTGASIFSSTITGTTIYGSTAVCSPVVFASTSMFSSVYCVNSYNSLSSTTSGQMGVLGHNAIASQATSNTITQMNNGYFGSFIRQYYNEGITFYTRANAGTAGDVLYGTSPVADGGERLRITSTGIACFACQVCAPSFNSSASSTLNGLSVTCNVVSNCFTGITVSNGAGGGSEASRAGIAFQAYDWVQSAIWHGRNTAAAFAGALLFGTNPNTANLSVGGVCTRLKIDNDGIATFYCNICTGKYLTVGSQGGEDIVFLGGGSGVGAVIQARYADGNPNVHFAGNGNSWINRTYGSVGIGTCTPAYKLDVSGATRVGSLLVTNTTTTTWCVGRIDDARANTWYTIYTWPGIYDGAFTLAQLGYEDNNGDGANAHAFWMTVGAAYSTGFSTSQIGGATNLCLQRSGQSLQALITGVTDRTSGAFIGYTLQTMIVAS